MAGLITRLGRWSEGAETWLAAHSLTLLRISLGVIFTLFGALKFFPDVSPAQELVADTTTILFLGLIPDDIALILVATVETAAGICLLINRFVRVALWSVVLQFAAILSPLVLLPGQLFSGPYYAPSLVGQYILKDFILLAAVLVLLGARRRS